MTSSWKPWEDKRTSFLSDVRKFLPKNQYGNYVNPDGLELSKEQIQELQKNLLLDNEAKTAALQARNREALASIPGKLKEGGKYLASDEFSDRIPEWMKGGKSWMQPTINPRDVGIIPEQIPITVDGKESNYAIPDRPGSEFTSGGKGLKFKSLAAQERFLEEDEKAIQTSAREAEEWNKAETERSELAQSNLNKDGSFGVSSQGEASTVNSIDLIEQDAYSPAPDPTVKDNFQSGIDINSLFASEDGGASDLNKWRPLDNGLEGVYDPNTNTLMATKSPTIEQTKTFGSQMANFQVNQGIATPPPPVEASTINWSETAGKASVLFANLANIVNILEGGEVGMGTMYKAPGEKSDASAQVDQQSVDRAKETVSVGSQAESSMYSTSSRREAEKKRLMYGGRYG